MCISAHNLNIETGRFYDLDDHERVCSMCNLNVVEGDNFIIDGKKIRLSAERNPADLKWGDIDVDVAIDCTPDHRKNHG
jgi:glyceraldehyde-3-phosphate dehydrogenase/erythrose-4-phosphate dehydrogenase